MGNWGAEGRDHLKRVCKWNKEAFHISIDISKPNNFYNVWYFSNTDIRSHNILRQLECVEFYVFLKTLQKEPPCMLVCRHGCTQCKDTCCSHRSEWAYPDSGQHVYLLCMGMANKVLCKTKVYCIDLCVKLCMFTSFFYSLFFSTFSLIHCFSLPSFAFLSIFPFTFPPFSASLLYHLSHNHFPSLRSPLHWFGWRDKWRKSRQGESARGS